MKVDVKKEIFDPIDKDDIGSLDTKEVEYPRRRVYFHTPTSEKNE